MGVFPGMICSLYAMVSWHNMLVSIFVTHSLRFTVLYYGGNCQVRRTLTLISSVIDHRVSLEMVLTEPDFQNLMNEFVIIGSQQEVNHYISDSFERLSGGLWTKCSNYWRSGTCTFAQFACFELPITRSYQFCIYNSTSEFGLWPSYCH